MCNMLKIRKERQDGNYTQSNNIQGFRILRKVKVIQVQGGSVLCYVLSVENGVKS